MASRAELVRVGLAALGEEGATPGAYEARMVRAVAAMLAAFRTTKKARTEDTKLIVPPRVLFDAIRAHASDKVLCEPVDARWFGRLGGALKAIPSFVPDDVQLLIDWLNAGGMRSWPQGVPTFSHLITHLDKWTAFAREWNSRGRQEMRGKTSVGAAATAESTDFSAFSVPKLL